MKWPVFLLSIGVCSLFLFLPCTSAACTGIVTPSPTQTYSPPGPYGTIYVESSPAGADVYLDGDARGRAPLTIYDLWPGTYEITARMTGFETYRSTITITGATRSAVYCRLTPDNSGGGLTVLSSPVWATVYLDGVEKGVTPLTLNDPAPGSHIIQLKRPGYDDWESTVDVEIGTGKSLSAVLKKNNINTDRGVNISSSPAGASVSLDGLARGFTPVTLYDLAAGIHGIQIDYPGYTSWKSTVTLPESGIFDLPVTLDPKPASFRGWIMVFSSPGNASVTLDGDYVGRTLTNNSLDLASIPAGDHTIALELAGYQPYSTRTSVSSKMVSTVTAVLVPVAVPPANGTLSVTSDPAGANVSVDNESVGISPLIASDIATGNHLVTIKMAGYRDYSASILVTGGATGTVSATLQPVKPLLKSPLSPLSVLGAFGIIGFFAVRKYH